MFPSCGRAQWRATHRGAALRGATTPTLIDTAEQRRIMWVAFRFGSSYPFFAVDTAAGDLMIGLGRPLRTRRRHVTRTTPRGPDGSRKTAITPVRLASAWGPSTGPRSGRRRCGCAASRPYRRHGGGQPRVDGEAFRHFSQQIGLCKRFARVRRFQRVLRRSASEGTSVDWAQLAARCVSRPGAPDT